MMRRLVWLALVLSAMCVAMPAFASTTRAEQQADAHAAHELASHPLHGNLPDYSLPPAKLVQARELGRLGEVFFFGGTAWRIVQMVLLLALGGVAWMRDRALRLSGNRWVQTFVFVAMFRAATWLLNLPLAVYGHHVGLRYGLSVERWPAWFADSAKSLGMSWVLLGLIAMLALWLIRALPRRWWLALWVAAVPLVLVCVMLAPVVVDPVFNRFEPLAAHHPEVAAQLERMGVPAGRQFLMKASAKVTTPNAYVTGLGPTKRVVVWDTSLDTGAELSPGVLWTVGHECGHYVHSDVLHGTLLALAGLLPALWLAAWFVRWALARWGEPWRIATQADLGALVVLLLASVLLTALSTPLVSTVSRNVEHNADIYGEEAIHGMVPDPQAAVRAACDDMGLRALEDPNPDPWTERLLYDHPSTGRRAAFGAAYDPWAAGMRPKYFAGK